MKKIILNVFFIFICNLLYSQNTYFGNNSIGESDYHIAENWEMLTNASFGYDLIFNNENKTIVFWSITFFKSNVLCTNY